MGQTGKAMADRSRIEPRPRSYSDKDWQAKTTDASISKAILGGGMAVGLSPLMPPNPDLAENLRWSKLWSS